MSRGTEQLCYITAKIPVAFQKEHFSCLYCPCFVEEYRFYHRAICKQTGEVLTDPQSGRGVYCPMQEIGEVDYGAL